MSAHLNNKNSSVPHPPLQQYYASEQHRREFVSRLFDDTAGYYDWIIRAMSLGSGGWYRRMALVRAGLRKGMNVLDVAIGTGPVAGSEVKIVGSEGSVVGLDRSINMLRETRHTLNIPLVHSDAGYLPFTEDSFDFLSMGYALRHVDDLDGTFREYFRVLKPGGKILILELTSPESKTGLAITRFYMRRVVPWIARIGSRSKDAETLMFYFWDTVENCVRPEIILQAMTDAGFKAVKRHTNISVFSEYRATKPE